MHVFESQNQNAYDLKNEASHQFEEAKILESTLPSSIIIGPFFVNVEPLRNRLAKKRVDIANAMLDLLARQLRKQSNEVGPNKFNPKILATKIILIM